MPVKQFNTRIQNKIDTNSTLNSSGLVPLKGELIIGGNLHGGTLTNTKADPFIAKIGDGTTTWQNLPSIGKPVEFTESTITINDGSGTEDLNVNMAISQNEKTYAKYQISSDLDDTSFTLNITGGNYMLTEHYLLFDNREGYDKYLSSVNIDGVEAENIFVQKDYISGGDIVQLNIMFYKIGNVLCCTITETPGLVNGGYF